MNKSKNTTCDSKNDDLNDKNNYTTEDQTNNTSSNTTTSTEELINQLETLNLSLDTLKVILLAIVLNYYFVYYTKVTVLDTLNDTKCAENLFDASKIPSITNVMFLYATGIFLNINYEAYVKINSVQGANRDPKAINKAYKAFFSSLLIFIATAISRSNIEI